MKNLKPVYCIASVKSSQMISIDQVIHFFDTYNICRDPQLRIKRTRAEKYLFSSGFISDRSIRVALFLSKMSVIDEGREGDLEYTHLRFVEFLEFLGRLAYLFFEKTSAHFEMTQAEKMNLLLGWIAEKFNHTLHLPSEKMQELDSESDDAN